jgi:hypothetical protein
MISDTLPVGITPMKVGKDTRKYVEFVRPAARTDMDFRAQEFFDDE